MRMTLIAFAALSMLATSGAAFAQEPQGGGSGEHGVGSGPDPRAMHSGMMMGHRMHRRMPMMMHRRHHMMMMHRHHHMRHGY